jgi:hypothetical protein
VQRLGHEVAAQEPPHGPVARARDGVVVLAQETHRREHRAVRQRGPTLHERRVREAAVRDEDGEAGPHAQGHDGAVPIEEAQQQVFCVGQRVGQPHHTPEQWQRRRARREAATLPRAEEEDRGGEEEQERADEELLRRVHGCFAPAICTVCGARIWVRVVAYIGRVPCGMISERRGALSFCVYFALLLVFVLGDEAKFSI